MSNGYLVAMAAVVVMLFGARLVLAGLPLSQAAPVSLADALLLVAGALGLAFHCLAMFFRDSVAWLPGADGPIGDVRALGAASLLWYVVPAGLVLLGFRRQHPAAVALVVVALVAVGITMYNGGSVSTHLAAIFASVVVSAGVAASLVLPPWGAAGAAEAPATHPR